MLGNAIMCSGVKVAHPKIALVDSGIISLKIPMISSTDCFPKGWTNSSQNHLSSGSKSPDTAFSLFPIRNLSMFPILRWNLSRRTSLGSSSRLNVRFSEQKALLSSSSLSWSTSSSSSSSRSDFRQYPLLSRNQCTYKIQAYRRWERRRRFLHSLTSRILLLKHARAG